MLSQAPTVRPNGDLQFHASSVSIDGRGLMLVGPSRSGKSTLALSLMALGAKLIADDITWVCRDAVGPMLNPAPNIAQRIEARGIGVLKAPATGPTPLHTILDLGTPEADRIPPRRTYTLLGHDVPLLHRPETDHVAAMILHYMRFGRAE